MARRLQFVQRSRAPDEESALPHVASDPVVQRPLRPEPPSGRAAAPAEHSGSFETLLDAAPAARTPRPARAARARSSESSDRNRPAGDRNQPRTDGGDGPTTAGTDKTTAATDKTTAATDKSAAKPADGSSTAEVKTIQLDGQALDSGQATVTATDAEGQIALVLPELVGSLPEAAAVEIPADAKPDAKINSETTGAKPNAADGADVTVAADATAPEVAAMAIVAIVAPAPAPTPALAPANAPVTNAPAAAPADGAASIVPIQSQATAPVVLPDSATPDIMPAATDAKTTDTAEALPAQPQVKDGVAKAEPAEKTTPADELKTLAPEIPSLSEPAEMKSSAADHKTEPGKAKTGQHADNARAAEAHSYPDAPPRKPDTPAEPPARPAAAQHAQAAEHAAPTARTILAEPRDLPATAAAPAQLNASAPPPPFSLAAPAMPLANLLPLTALRLDPTTDNTVPIAGLAVEIVSRVQDGLRRFEIRLDPPELGRIDVRLDVDSGGKVTSRLTVERAETLDLLRRDAPQLERALQHAGLNTEGGLEFSLRDQTFANREQAPRDLPATRLIVPDDEPATAEAARRGYGRLIGLGGGVDIRV